MHENNDDEYNHFLCNLLEGSHFIPLNPDLFAPIDFLKEIQLKKTAINTH